MNVLLIVSHGSRRSDSNDEVRRLAGRIAGDAGSAFHKVGCAFLELTGPSIDVVIAELAAGGATTIVVFPYFLAAGTHVASDIPRIIDGERARYPHIGFHVIPHFGAMEGLGELILSHVDLSASRLKSRG